MAQGKLALHLKERLAVKGGVGLSYFEVRNNMEPDDVGENEEHHLGGAMNTQFTYRYKRWELGAASYVHFGKMKNFRYTIANNTIVGDGMMISVSYGPILKYYTDYSPRDPWQLYLLLAPQWALHTVNLSRYEVRQGEYSDKYKISYQTRGVMVGVGAEELLPHKEMHPAYLELVFYYNLVHRASILDKGDYQEVEPIEEERVDHQVKGYIIMLNIGITFF